LPGTSGPDGMPGAPGLKVRGWMNEWVSEFNKTHEVQNADEHTQTAYDHQLINES
jgi:hypothetical protein